MDGYGQKMEMNVSSNMRIEQCASNLAITVTFGTEIMTTMLYALTGIKAQR